MRCGICGKLAPELEAAIDLGWEPSYYIGEDEMPDPICPECSTEHCDHTEDGTVFREGAAVPVSFPTAFVMIR